MNVFGELERAQLEQVATLPTGAGLVKARIVYLTTLDGGNPPGVYYYSGSAWVEIGEISAITIADNAVTDAKIRDSAALTVIGRSANSSGDPADIAAGTDGHVLRRSGTTLGFGTIARTALPSVGQQVSSSVGDVNTTSATFVSTGITNLTATITTTGRPIWVGLIGDGSTTTPCFLKSDCTSASAASAEFRILRDGVEKYLTGLNAPYTDPVGVGRVWVPGSSLHTLDVVGAGTYVYTVEFRVTSARAGHTAGIANARLVAYEL